MMPQSVNIARRGFTLAEILAVVVIILVLLALLLPALNNSLGKTNRTLCTNNARQIITSQIHYASDFAGQFVAPNTAASFADYARFGASTNKGWWAALSKTRYLPNAQILICPVLAGEIVVTPGYFQITNAAPVGSSPSEGTWESIPDADNVRTAFAMFAGLGTDTRYTPLNGEPPMVSTLWQGKSRNVLITHRYNDSPGHDDLNNTHGGRGLPNALSTAAPPDNDSATDSPVGYMDNSATINFFGDIPVASRKFRYNFAGATALKIVY